MKRNTMTKLLSLLLACLLLAALSAQALADDAFFCRKCGKAIPADSNFCPYCGEAVIVLPTPTATAEAEPAPAEVDKSTTDAIIAELIASIRTAAAENPKPAAAEAPAATTAAAPAAEPAATEPGPFQTVLKGNNLVYNEKVRVTKSPTSESVPYGGAAIFIARADYDTGITWYIASPDASTIYNVSDAPYYSPCLVAYGQGTETLTLCEIPSWMNGWQVQAGFSGKDGPVYSGIAYIYTYQLEQPYYEPTPCCEPTWCDWTWPSGWPSPDWNGGWAGWTNWTDWGSGWDWGSTPGSLWGPPPAP